MHSHLLNAVKSIRQDYNPNQELGAMMETFRQMVNHCIRLGLESNISTLKRLSSRFYHELDQYNIQSKYKLTAMSQACGRLSQIKREIKKRRHPKMPYVTKPFLVSCYGFKINGRLLSIPVGNRNYINIILNEYTQRILLDPNLKVKSFVITSDSISLCIQKQVEEIVPENVIGLDRNLRNITISTPENTIMYKTNKVLSIKENTMHVISSLNRNDHRIMQKIYSKLGNRRTRRVQQYLHRISRDIIQRAKESHSMIVLENIKGIRKLYRRGNGQGRKYRQKLNSWSFYELQRQIQYKAAWEGISVRFVDPKRTSQLCPICGNRTQGDRLQHRKLWCSNCRKLMDRDVVAALNISYKGWSRFCHPRGLANEAMKRNVYWNNVSLQPLILGVDGSKLQIQR